MSRRSKYDIVLRYIDKIEQWVKDGGTDKEISANLGIAYSAYRRYRALGDKGDERYAALVAVYARAAIVPNEAVKAALYKKCIGYNAKIAKHYKVKHIEYDPDTGKKISERETLQVAYDEVHVPADTNAQIFWLSNRWSDEWARDPKRPDADPEDTGVVELPGVDGDG